MANKNIAVTSDIEYAGDFKPLKDSLDEISAELNAVISQIRSSAQQVSSGAEQVASGAQALASGSTEQASAVEEVFASLNSISEETKQTAANAEDARYITEEASAFVEQGNQKMKEMIESMDNIYNASNEIKKIIKTLEDIAFQTNILALNASVEAARAGMAEKGFAVVASEVKNLATKSAEAAKTRRNSSIRRLPPLRTRTKSLKKLRIRSGTSLKNKSGRSSDRQHFSESSRPI